MKKLLVLALLAFAAAGHRAHAAAAVSPVLDTQGGTRVPASAAPNLLYIGAPVYRVEVSTPADTAVLLLAGQGLLYSVRCSSGSVGAYALAFDSATGAGITVGTSGKALTSQVFSSGQIAISGSTQTVTLSNDQGFDAHQSPVPFTNGLVGIVHGSVLNCLFQARLNTGNNPGP